MALTDKLTAIADAIRGKTGKTDGLTLDAMPGEIEGIQTGGGSIDNELWRGVFERTLTEFSDDTLTTIGPYAFYGWDLESVDLPNVTKLGDYSFSLSGLPEVNFPNVSTIGMYAFESCPSLAEVNMPELTEATGPRPFSRCNALKVIKLPKLAKTSYEFLLRNDNLETVILPSVTEIASCTFERCYSLTAVILPGETVCKLLNKDAFSNAYHYLGTVNATFNPEGLKDGYIYVPSALIEEYKAATNWSNYATQFRALEDYTVDGTTTGELDPTKI